MGQIEILDKFKQFAEPHRYKIAYGGRGSAKSWQIARLLLIDGLKGNQRILCTREIQNSLQDSVHSLLSDQIKSLGLEQFYQIKKTEIISVNGTRFLFEGLRYNINKIKSLEGIDKCWVEEAEKVPSNSWTVLIPTIRKDGSEIWISFNPDAEDDPVYDRFILNTPPDSVLLKINHYDNPFFPEVLKKEMEYDREYDYDKYLWIWEGNTRQFTEACVFNGKFTVDDFQTPEDAEFMHGADWGFAQDPDTLIRCYVKDDKLYIDREAWGQHVEIPETPALFDTIDTARDWSIIADNARPELISYMKQHGFRRIVAAKKGANSIEEGVERLRGFSKIVIHTRCTHTIEEFKLYSYKRNSLTGDIMPIIEDKHNHMIDALRYATENINRRRMKIVRYS